MASFGVISYGLAAAGFLILTLLLAISWEGRGQGIRLVIACAINAAWAALLVYVAWAQRMPLALVAFALFLRDAAWLFVLTGLVSGGAWPFRSQGSCCWSRCIAMPMQPVDTRSSTS
jgi:hypothetical protein